MFDKNYNSIFKLKILNGITYSEENLKIAFSGEYKWLDDNGSYVKSTYYEGKCISQESYEEGMKRVSKTMFNDNGSKEVIIYDNNGLIRFKNNVLNGKLEGATTIFVDGILYMTTEYKNGKKNGENIVYAPDGSVFKREYFINDVKQD